MQAQGHSVIDSAGALALRRDIYSKPAVTRGDLSMLLSEGRAAGTRVSAEFTDLLSSVATDLLVHQPDPPQYIQQADADWLIAQLRDGEGLCCRAEYEMLADVIRYSVCVPANLAAFAVAEIEKAIVKGHAADGEADHAAGVVSAADVEALRIAVFAATDGSSLRVTRESAEALFRIAHATARAANAESFDDFFAKAVGNYLMGIAFHWTPTAAAERGMEKWLEEKPSFGSFLSNMLSGKLVSDWSGVDKAEDADLQRENAADEAEIARRSHIGAADADWILAQLTRGAELTSAEAKLLMFLSEESLDMPANLKERIGQRAA